MFGFWIYILKNWILASDFVESNLKTIKKVSKIPLFKYKKTEKLYQNWDLIIWPFPVSKYLWWLKNNAQLRFMCLKVYQNSQTEQIASNKTEAKTCL